MSNKLAEIRTQSNFKLRELAIRARVSASTLSDIERYGYVPRLTTQQKIAQALDVEATIIWPETQSSSDSTVAKASGRTEQEKSK
jgi:transcriptional regulator with XRE-family HTH domain